MLTFSVLNDLWVTGLHDSDAGVGCAQIDTHDTKREGRVRCAMRRSYVEKFLAARDLAKKAVLFL